MNALVISGYKSVIKPKVANSAFVALQLMCCLAGFEFSFNLLMKIEQLIGSVWQCSELYGELKNPFMSSSPCAESQDRFWWISMFLLFSLLDVKEKAVTVACLLLSVSLEQDGAKHWIPDFI